MAAPAKTVKDVAPASFIAGLAAHLKSHIDLPDWADLIKTGTHKELCPQDANWYYVRAASVARKIYLRGGTGVGACTKIYGGRKRKTTRARHFHRAAKGLHRHILQQLEKLQVVATAKDKKGRWITTTGQQLLDQIANQVATGKPAKAGAGAAAGGAKKGDRKADS